MAQRLAAQSFSNGPHEKRIKEKEKKGHEERAVAEDPAFHLDIFVT